MEFPIGLLVIGASLAFVIWLIARTNSAARRIAELTVQQTYLEQELARLRRRLDAAEGSIVAKRPSKPAPVPRATEGMSPVTGREAELRPSPPPPIRPMEATPVAPLLTPPAIPPPPVMVPREPSRAGPTIWDTINWEQFLGVKFFAWIGGLALFLAVVFFVKYAFEHNLISPALRVAAGFLVGVGLLGGGALLHRREQYTVGAQALCGTGVVILYATTYAARSFYSLIGAVPAFVLMILITAAAFLLAVRFNALVVAILGLCGGFLTPVLLSTGQDNPLGLFGYLAFLNAGLLAVALHKRWDFLALMAAVGTVAMQLGWVAEFFVREKYFEGNKVLIAAAVFLAFCVLFLAAWLWARRRNASNAWLTVSAIALTAVAMLFSIELLGYEPLGQRPGLVFSYVLLVDLCLLVFPWLEQKLAGVHLAAGVAVFLVLALWTWEHVSGDLLYWALALCFVFALLHAALPLMFRHLRPSRAAPNWERVFPPSAILPFLLLVLVVTRLPLADPSPVFGLAMLLSVLFLGLTRMSPPSWLPAVGLGCVLVLVHVWHFRQFTADAAAAPLSWYLGFTLLFTGFPFLFWRRFANQIVPWATAAPRRF